VVPGDRLDMVVTMLRHKRNIGWVTGEATVDGQFACSAEIMFSIVSNPRIVGAGLHRAPLIVTDRNAASHGDRSSGAEIGKYSEIGPYCIVGEHVSIGARTILQAHVVVNGWTRIGTIVSSTRFRPWARRRRTKVRGRASFTRVGSRTILREYVSIHRATGRDELTAVGDDCLLLAYVHIAHNCILGNGVTMSNLAQLAGHVNVGDYVTIGGQTGIHQLRVSVVTPWSRDEQLTKDVPPFFLVEGNPCQPYVSIAWAFAAPAFPVEERQEIKRFYKLLYDPSSTFSQAIEAMKRVTTDAGRENHRLSRGAVRAWRAEVIT